MIHLHRRSIRSFRLATLLVVLTVFVGIFTATAQEIGEGRAVLVTGASTGIGLRMTEVLAENGFYVYAGARDTQDLERLGAIENVTSVRLDVTVQSEIDAAARLIRAEGKGLYGLINNAGVATLGPLIEMSDEEMNLQLDVNLVGPFRVTKAFSDLIIESQGRIMTTSSIAGIVTGPLGAAYSMSKHGVEAYTDGLAAEMERFGVRVAAVEPGNYKSQIVASMMERMRAGGYSAEGSRFGSMLDLIQGPLDRSQYQEPDDVALAALDFLTSDSPKRRYMVVPNQFEAAMTIQQAFLEMAQLNADQAFTYSRDELIQMLDSALGQVRNQSDSGSSSPNEPESYAGDQATSNFNLHDAAAEGNLDAVRLLVEAGADVDEKESGGGSSPLLIAAVFGQTEVARALIDAEADVNQQNNDGSTALLTAAMFCRTEIVEMLLENGADKSLRNNSGSNALDTVSVPFEAIKEIYDYFGTVLELELDYDHLRNTRPKIAEMLR